MDGNDWSAGNDAYRDDHPVMQFVGKQLEIMRMEGTSKKEARRGGLLEKVESAAWSQILAWLLHVTTIRVTYSSLFSIFNFWSCGYSFRSHRPVSCQHPLVKNNAETASSSEAFKRTEEHFRERQWC